MFTYKYIISKNNALRLRLTANRKTAELALGLTITKQELENALSLKPGKSLHPCRKYLQGVAEKMEQIRIEMLEGNRREVDVQALKQTVKAILFPSSVMEPEEAKVSEYNFVKWFTEFADTHNTPGAKTKADYMHTLSRMRCFCTSLDKLDFADINVRWLEKFDCFLAKTCKVNSRNHHMRNIRAVFKYAIRHELDIRNPFDRMKLKTEETEKRSLTVEELRWVFTCDVLPYAEIYRDMFLLSFMLIGINPIDLYRLESVTSSGRIKYRRAKTHKLYSIKVEPEAARLIKKYQGTDHLLSLSDRWEHHESFSACANKALKLLGAPAPAPNQKRKGKSKLPELTMYWARHTWATLAAELDIPDAVISNALGHSGGLNRTTEIYIKRSEKKVDEANRKVLDWVLYGKK